MGANHQEHSSLVFWGLGNLIIQTLYKLFYITVHSSSIRLKSQNCVFVFFGNFENVGQGAIWREIMWGEVSSVIYSSMLWV